LIKPFDVWQDVVLPERFVVAAGGDPVSWSISKSLRNQPPAIFKITTESTASTYPSSNKGWDAYVLELKNDRMPRERIQMLRHLLGVVGFALLIGCVREV